MNTINNHGIELSVTVNGRPTRTYFHEDKYFIESRDGTEYAIEIKNNNWYRVEAVVAVDGLSVITGKAASKDDSGYIISGHDKLVVKGFRKDLNEVGAFKFTKKEKSYAAGKGQADNVGVIAVAIYKEKNSLPLWNDTFYSVDSQSATTGTSTAGLPVTSPTYTCTNYPINGTVGSKLFRNTLNSTEPVASYNAQAVSFDHGTTWGQKLTDKVVTTTFDRATLIFTTELFYNSKENLEALGIKLIQEKLVTLPRGFPVDFAEPPSGWNS